MKVVKMMTLVIDRDETLWEKEKMLVTSIFSLYACRRQDVLWDHLWRVGGQRSHSLSGAYLKDYASYGHEWIDLIKAECSAQEP